MMTEKTLSNYEKIIIESKRQEKNFAFIAKELGITRAAFSVMLKNIKVGKGTVESLRKIGGVLNIRFEI